MTGEMMDRPKVSVVMPSLNVRPYIEQCLESVLGQTLQEIEILCVDAGSDDGTLEVLQQFAARDPRVRVIVSEKKSYGYQVNMGLDAATGEYIGIVETDDFTEPDMYEKLYVAAKADDLDVCKAGFYFYWSNPAKVTEENINRAGGKISLRAWEQLKREQAKAQSQEHAKSQEQVQAKAQSQEHAQSQEQVQTKAQSPAQATSREQEQTQPQSMKPIQDVPYPVASSVMAARVFCPAEAFQVPLERVDFFNIKPSIWSAIYKRSFLEEHGIRLNETPGASFQDTAFNFKVFAVAKRVRMLEDLVLHYRQDNEQSSVNNPGKMFCLCDEYAAIDEFLDARPELKGSLEGVKVRLKYDAYVWNCNRLDPSLRLEFLERASKEFRHELEMGYADRACFITYKWKVFLLIIQDPQKFLEKGIDGIWAIDIEFDEDRWFTRALKKINGGIYCIRDHGLSYTIKLGFDKIKDRKDRERRE